MITLFCITTYMTVLVYSVNCTPSIHVILVLVYTLLYQDDTSATAHSNPTFVEYHDQCTITLSKVL